jgi:glycosyltransferase involved in cell wall biosynthesis
MKFSLLGPVYPYRGGIALHTSQLAAALKNAGHLLQVISYSRQYPRWLFPGASDRDPSQAPLKIDAEYILDPLYPWTWAATARRISTYNPTAAIIPWWITFYAPAYWSVARLLRRGRIKVLFLIHNVFPHEARPLDRWVTRKVFEQGDFHLVQSPGEKARLLDLLPDLPVAVCPHPVYDFFSDSKLGKDRAKAQLGISVDKPVVLFFGFVRPYKGLHQAVSAIGLLQSRGILAHLLIAGEFWDDRKKYERQIEQLGLSEHVTMEDRYIPNEEIPRYFSAADVFVAPYLNGSQSGAIRVALSFGIPVIATESIADEMLSASPSATIIPAGDSKALATAIVGSLEKPDTRPITGKEAAASWSRMVCAIEGLLNRENAG